MSLLEVTGLARAAPRYLAPRAYVLQVVQNIAVRTCPFWMILSGNFAALFPLIGHCCCCPVCLHCALLIKM